MVFRARIQRMAQRLGGRHNLLLLTLLLLAFVGPVASGVGATIFDLLLLTILLGGVRAVAGQRRVQLLASTLAILMVALASSLYFYWSVGLMLVADLVVIAFCLLVVTTILKHVLLARRVTQDVISGALCVFLLLGLTWAYVFSALDLLQPGSFLPLTQYPEVGSALEFMRIHHERMHDLSYFSYVTIATLGYGDIAPRTPVAQSWAAMEAILGQMYLIVLVARLVGLNISQSTSSP